MGKGGRPYKVAEELETLYYDIEQGDLQKVKQVTSLYGIDAHDTDKRSALINATFYGQIEIMRWLIENGADLNYQDRIGYTPLHFAETKV